MFSQKFPASDLMSSVQQMKWSLSSFSFSLSNSVVDPGRAVWPSQPFQFTKKCIFARQIGPRARASYHCITHHQSAKRFSIFSWPPNSILNPRSGMKSASRKSPFHGCLNFVKEFRNLALHITADIILSRHWWILAAFFFESDIFLNQILHRLRSVDSCFDFWIFVCYTRKQSLTKAAT